MSTAPQSTFPQLTREELETVIQSLTEMKKEGIDTSNPRFAALVAMVRANRHLLETKPVHLNKSSPSTTSPQEGVAHDYKYLPSPINQYATTPSPVAVPSPANIPSPLPQTSPFAMSTPVAITSPLPPSMPSPLAMSTPVAKTSPLPPAMVSPIATTSPMPPALSVTPLMTPPSMPLPDTYPPNKPVTPTITTKPPMLVTQPITRKPPPLHQNVMYNTKVPPPMPVRAPYNQAPPIGDPKPRPTPAHTIPSNVPHIPVVPNNRGPIPIPGPRTQSVFTPAQVMQLKAQIRVYRYLASHTPVPNNIVNPCLTEFYNDPNVRWQLELAQQAKKQQQLQQYYEQKQHYQQQQQQKQQQQMLEHQQQQQYSSRPPPHMHGGPPMAAAPKKVKTITKPPAPIPYGRPVLNHPNSSPVVTTVYAPPVAPPSKYPAFDMVILTQDREKRIQNELKKRFKDLTSNPSPPPADSLLAYKVEVERIKLYPQQYKTRHEVVEYLRYVQQHKSAMKGGKRKRTRSDRTRSKRQAKQSKEKDFLISVVNHSKVVRDHHVAQKKKVKKLMSSLSTYHATKQRRLEQQREKEEKERLRALRENDEVAYRKLLEKTKNDRLTQLLTQTDEYLNQIGAKVQQVKQQGPERSAPKHVTKALSDMTEEEKRQLIEKEKEDAKQSQSTKAYYSNAHSIQEDVVQPPTLIGGTLKPYQLRGLQWMVSLFNNHLNGVLADEMGLGKTIQTIALLTYLTEKKGCNGPFLIIVPTSVLPNWQSELQKWAPSLVSVAYKGSAKIRKQLFKKGIQQYNIVLVSYEFIIRDKSTLSKIKWEYIIIDEGHRLKNAKSKLSFTLATYYQANYRLLLTGTPLQNSLPELWSLLNFLLPTIFNSMDNFQNWFSAPFAAAGENSEMTEEETTLIIHRLHKVLRPFLLRRLKTEVEDQLPKKTEIIIRCEASAMQRKLTDSLLQHGRTLRDPKTLHGRKLKTAKNITMELRKVCNHPYLCSSSDYYLNDDLIRCAGKFATLDSLLLKLKTSGHRVLIFSQMTEVMTILEDMLKYRQHQYLRLDGQTTPDGREELPRLFNAPNSPYFVFILSTRAGGQGLNLQAADTVVIFDSDWNPQMDLQAQDRAHRIGQTRDVRVFRLVTINSIEETILDRASHKLDVDQKIIQAGMFNNRSSVVEQKEYLRKLLHKTEDHHNLDVPSPEQFNKMISRSDEEFRVFQELDIVTLQRQTEKYALLGFPAPPPPIMQEKELPAWLLVDIKEEEEKQERMKLPYGRGRRARTKVNYSVDKHMEEESEESGEMEESVSEVKEEEADEELDFYEPSDFIILPKKRNLEEFSEAEDTKAPPRKKRKSSSSSRKKKIALDSNDLPSSTAVSFTDKLLHAYNVVRYCTDDLGRERSYLFQKLPSKRDYPDYYQLISSPIDLKTIKKRIVSKVYPSLHDFKVDMNLLFTNACTYNIDTSQVYQDALVMKELFNNDIQSLFPDEVKKK